MKVSLNELVQMLADRVGQPFSIPLQEELKLIFNYKRADWFQKIVSKYPGQRKFFLKGFTEELEEVSQAECPIDTDCRVFRTVHKIPVPVRTEYALFDYVGDPDKTDAYGYASPDDSAIVVKYGSKYTKDRPKYYYENGYIFILNEEDLEYIGIRGLWPDQRQLKDFKCDDVPCYTDDDQYDIPADIINTMVQDILKNELRLIAPELGEIPVDEQKQQ